MCSIHTQITKQIQDSEIKTCNSLFHLGCLEFFFFLLVFIPRAKLCILLCHQLAFNLLGILSRFLSAHRWVIAAALHPAKRGVSQLRDHYLDPCPTAPLSCGPQVGHVAQIRQGTEPWRDTDARRWCCKAEEIADEQIGDIRHAMGRVAGMDLGAENPPIGMNWSLFSRFCLMGTR